MDLSSNESSGRQVSVIVSPKADFNANNVMMKALATNPWATALMMQYATVAPAMMEPYEQALGNAFAADLVQPQLPPTQPNQRSFGALLKAAMRNRNGNGSNEGAPTAPGSTVCSPQQLQTPSSVPNRMSYPREFKLFVIGYYFSNGQNKYRTCKEFQITKSMLNGWLQKLEKIQQSRPGSLKAGRSGRKPQFPQVESELYNVYLACIAQGKKVGNRWLRDTAKCIAQRRCSTDELNGMCQFSERWLCNFKKRFGINLTKNWNEKPSTTDTLIESEAIKSPTITDSITNIKPDPADIRDEPMQLSPDTTVDSDKAINLVVPEGHKRPIPNHEPHQTPPHRPTNHSHAYEPGKRGRKVQFPQVEQALFKKVQDKQLDGARISNRWLQDEARRLAIELCPQLFTDTFKSARCMFSEHWLHNFKKRYGITLKQQNIRPDDAPVSRVTESALNLVLSEPVSSTDDLKTAKDEQRYANQASPAEGKISNTIDDLPTMVPLPLIGNVGIPPAINFAEWYSKNTTMANRNEVQENPTMHNQLSAR